MIYKYNNLTQFAAELRTAAINPLFDGEQASIDGSRQFTGTDSYEEADELFAHGDSASAAMIKAATPARIYTTVHRNRPATDIVGYLPHVPNYLANRPDAMITSRPEPKRVATTTILYHNKGGWKRTVNELATGAANLITAIKALEAGGTRVTLWLAISGRVSCGETASVAIKVKDAGDKNTVDKLAYPLINPSFLRRHYFRFIETRAALKSRDWPRTYGGTIPTDEFKQELSEAGIKFNSYLEVTDAIHQTQEEIINQLKTNSK